MKYRSNDLPRRRLFAVPFTLLILFVFCFTFFVLILPANSQTVTVNCGIAEHRHTEDCFAMPEGGRVLICCDISSADKISHIHDSLCYDEDGCIICPLEEQLHSHTDACFDSEGTVICGYSIHQHSELCFADAETADIPVLTCGTPSHSHTDRCYEEHNVSENAALPMSDNNDMDDNEEDAYTEEPAPEYDEKLPEGTISVGTLTMKNAPSILEITGNSSGIDLRQSGLITSSKTQYNIQGTNNWADVTESNKTNLPGNVDYRFVMDFGGFTIGDLLTHNKSMYLTDLPNWITIKDGGFVLDNEQRIAGDITVSGSTAYITFYDSFFEGKTDEMNVTGDFTVQGHLDWTQAGNSVNVSLPNIDVDVIGFEPDLAEKYGNISVEKSCGELIPIGGDQYALKYTITVKNLDNGDIPNVKIVDKFTNGQFIDEFYGISYNNTLNLTGNEVGKNPFETVTGGTGHGSVNLSSDKTLTWYFGSNCTAADIKSNETRTLTYYVKLDKYYTGGANRGDITNNAQAYSNSTPRNKASSVYSPVVSVNMGKTETSNSLDETGTGYIYYTVSVKTGELNSYPLINLCLRDIIEFQYPECLSYTGNYTVTKNGIDITADCPRTVSGDSFDITIPRLEKDEEIFVTYSVKADHIYAYGNGEVRVDNSARVLSENISERDWEHRLNNFTCHSYYKYSKWSRKIYGTPAPYNMTVYMSGNRYNANGSASSATSFNVEKGTLKYDIIVNETGGLDFSSSTLGDAITDGNGNRNVKFCGYVQVKEFTKDAGFPVQGEDESDESFNARALSYLNNKTADKTVWMNIDNASTFNFTPKSLGLHSNKTYQLTYYAKIVDKEFGKISVGNSFRITGTVGINDQTITNFPGIEVTVSESVSGNIDYNAKKEFLTLNKHSETEGEMYWLIRAEGSLEAGLALRDTLEKGTFGEDAIVGAFKAPANMDFSEFSDYDSFVAENAAMITPVSGYNPGALDGKSVYLLSRENSKYAANKAAQTGSFWGLGFDLTPTAVWHIEKVKDRNKYYIYSIVNGENKYIKINNSAQSNNVELSDTPQELSISSIENGNYKIHNGGSYLSPFNFAFVGYKRDNNTIEEFTFIFADGTTVDENAVYRYTLTSEKEFDVKLNSSVPLTPDEALYFIIKSNVNDLSKKTDTINGFTDPVYRNQLQISDKHSTSWSDCNTAEYVYKPVGAIYKEDKGGYYYDGIDNQGNKILVPCSTYGNKENWTKVLKDSHLTDYIKEVGTYANWIINVNWNGDIKGSADIIEMLPEGCELTFLVLGWRPDGAIAPIYGTIPECDRDPANWEYHPNDYGNVPFYYNKKTREIRWRINNLQKGSGYNDKVSNIQYRIMVKVGQDKVLCGGGGALENTVYITAGNVIDSDTEAVTFTDTKFLRKEFEKVVGGNNILTDDSSGGLTCVQGNIPFIITVNEYAEELYGHTVLPPLVDEISANLRYVEESVSVTDADDNIVTGYSFTVTERDGHQVMTIRDLPNGKKLFIRYGARSVETDDHTIMNVENKAYWEGFTVPDIPQTSMNHIYFDIKGSAHAEGAELTIFKSDKENAANMLPGAEFALYKTDSDDPFKTGTTNEKGQLHFTGLLYDTVYYIKETKSPAGYVPDTSEKYFIILKSDANGNLLMSAAELASIKEQYDDILVWYSMVNSPVCKMYIRNSRVPIRLKKKFADPETGVEPKPTGSFMFGLYTKNETDNTYLLQQKLTITYEKQENSEEQKITYELATFTYNDGNINVDTKSVEAPEFTCGSSNIPYYIFELDPSLHIIKNGGTFHSGDTYYSVSYSSTSNTGNTQPNMAIITNNQNPPEVTVTNSIRRIRLPEAGGTGTQRHFALGAAMAIVALGGMMIKRKKR